MRTPIKKCISTLSTLLFTLSLGAGLLGCDTDKEDSLETGASEPETGGDDGDESGESGDDETASTSAGGDDGDDGDDETASTSAGSGGDDGDDGDSAGTSAGSGGDDDGDDSDTEGTGGSGGEADGIAILHGDLPKSDPGDSGDTGAGSGTDGDSAFPDDALLVILDNDDAATCADPWAASECGGNWSISFTLLPEELEPGIYDLEDLNGGSFFLDEADEFGECGGGGGTLSGTLVLESVDEDMLVGHIEDADAFDFDANVSFVVPRC